MNHLMLHKVGIQSFYGQAFLPDVHELSAESPYTKSYFEELLTTGRIKFLSDIWYQEKKILVKKRLGVSMPSFQNQGVRIIKEMLNLAGHSRRMP